MEMNQDAGSVFESEESSRQKVLLVDDRPENLAGLEATLEDPRIELLKAASGEEALRVLLDQNVSLVLLDVQMPRMDGYEVARLMRRARRTRHVPILFITAYHSDEEAVLKGYESGAIDYIQKPVNPALLRAKVSLLLEYDHQRIELRQARDRLQAQRSYYESILNAAGEGIVCFDLQGTVRFANPAAQRMLNLPVDRFIGESYRAFFLTDGEDPGWQSTPMYRAWEERREIRIDEAELASTGRDKFPASVCCSPLLGPRPGIVLVFQDISTRKGLEEQLRRQISTDNLTGLANRSGFKHALQVSLARSARTFKHVALLFIDLDRFKQINDSLGHDTGDQLLQAVADRLRHCVRLTDVVCRLGGDEFTVILEELDDPEDAALSARKIITAFQEPFHLNGVDIVVTTSVGIATYPDSGEDSSSLLKAADIAMYRAKSEGRNNYHFYTPEMNARAEARMALEQDLRSALNRNELLLHYQPQIDLYTGRIVGFEALARWNSNVAGAVPPDMFIPLLEESGSILNVGAWIIDTACRQLREWRDLRLIGEECRIAINLSPRQFCDESLGPSLEKTLRSVGLPPDVVELELTESLLMRDTEQTYRVLDMLNDMGVRFSVDDFGTGYSSLAYLRRFRLDTLKIDRSFIHHVHTDPNDRAISASIVQLAHNLGLRVVAEGVETPPQVDVLRDMGCDVAQGFYYAMPASANEAEAHLRRVTENKILH